MEGMARRRERTKSAQSVGREGKFKERETKKRRKKLEMRGDIKMRSKVT